MTLYTLTPSRDSRPLANEKKRRNGPERIPSFSGIESKGPSIGHFDNTSHLLKFISHNETMSAWLYILRLKSGQLYIGSTTDLKKRFQDHQNGHACRTTKLDPPVKMVYSESLPTFSDARKREAQIKRWSRAQKEALVAGDIVRLQYLSKSRTKRKSTPPAAKQ